MNISPVMRSLMKPCLCVAFSLLGLAAFAQPANDNPCNATALTVNATCVNTNGTVQNATGSGVAAPGCGSGNQDVWYTVTVPTSGNLVVNTVSSGGNPLNNAGMAFYTVGNCATVGSFVQVACNDDQSFFDQMPRIAITCATPGQVLYIRVWKQSGGSSARTFSICATDPGPGPSNDDPCAATPLAVNISCTSTTGTNAQACPTAVAAPGCAGYSGGDVWFSMVVPTGGTFTVSTSVNGFSALTDGGMAIYSATNCANPGTFSLLGCDDNSGPGNMPQITLTGQTAGQTLYIRFWENGNNAFGAFDICVTRPLPNDAPCGALPLSVTATCGYTTYTNVGATNAGSFPAPGCGNFGTGSLDVWFSFVAPATGIAIIESQAGTLTDGAMALYSANACNGTFSLVQCNDDGGAGTMPFLSFTGLTPGATYYLRYWGYGTSTGSFQLCVHGPSTMPAGQCIYLLQMFDSGNDGWGSSSVGISLNGGAFTPYTVTGTYDLVLIGVNIGTVVVVQYTATGGSQGQNSYTLGLLTGGGNIYASGSPPPAGIVFTQTVTCTPPPAPANDCNGSLPICSGQSFNNNSSGTGNVADLNATNQGCLSSGERQGTWYRFSPSSPGTIGFTIAPSLATTDYDFAVWGPSNSILCPPTTAPLRCSYSASTGNTGVGNGATDVSEGATGDKWVSTFPAVAGQFYVLYIDNFSANGQSFALTWQLGGGASLDCTVLPVELLTFDVTSSGAVVDLRWVTGTERDNDHFVIERSADGEEFEVIGSLPGAGSSDQAITYGFQDTRPLAGVSYYRLRQVDIDGRFAFSPVRMAERAWQDAKLRLFPNPGSRQLEIWVEEDRLGASISLFDMLGKEVLRTRIAGVRTVLDTDRLPAGLFTVRISGESTEAQQQTWVKQF